MAFRKGHRSLTSLNHLSTKYISHKHKNMLITTKIFFLIVSDQKFSNKNATMPQLKYKIWTKKSAK